MALDTVWLMLLRLFLPLLLVFGFAALCSVAANAENDDVVPAAVV